MNEFLPGNINQPFYLSVCKNFNWLKWDLICPFHISVDRNVLKFHAIPQNVLFFYVQCKSKTCKF